MIHYAFVQANRRRESRNHRLMLMYAAFVIDTVNAKDVSNKIRTTPTAI